MDYAVAVFARAQSLGADRHSSNVRSLLRILFTCMLMGNHQLRLACTAETGVFARC
jgi:hypothetical protein